MWIFDYSLQHHGSILNCCFSHLQKNCMQSQGPRTISMSILGLLFLCDSLHTDPPYICFVHCGYNAEHHVDNRLYSVAGGRQWSLSHWLLYHQPSNCGIAIWACVSSCVYVAWDVRHSFGKGNLHTYSICLQWHVYCLYTNVVGIKGKRVLSPTHDSC